MIGDALDRQSLLYTAPLSQYSQPISLPATNLLHNLELMTYHFDTINHHNGNELTCVISANSTMMLKHHNDICRQAVDIDILLGNIARRLISLGHIVGQTPYPVHDFLPTTNARLISDQSQIKSHIRKKQQNQQTMTGINGYWIYQGDLQQALPWLCIGQWLGIGNKTSFGFGDYQWQILHDQ